MKATLQRVREKSGFKDLIVLQNIFKEFDPDKSGIWDKKCGNVENCYIKKCGNPLK